MKLSFVRNDAVNRVFVDVVVWDERPLPRRTGLHPVLRFLSVTGDHETLRRLRAHLGPQGAVVTLEGSGGSTWRGYTWGRYRRWVTVDAVGSHGIWAAEALFAAASDVTEEDGAEILFTVWPDQDFATVVFEHLRGRFTTPLLPEWDRALVEALRRRHALRQLPTWSATDPPPVQVWAITLSQEALDQLVSELVRSRALWIPGGAVTIPADRDPKTVDSLSTFLLEYAPLLADKVQQAFHPDYTPGMDQPHPVLATGFLRAALPAQADIIESLARAWRRQRAVKLVAQPGTGKTLMAVQIVHRLEAERLARRVPISDWRHLPWDRHPRGAYRVLVMAPDHLLAKWPREIQATIPDAVVETPHTLADWLAAIPRLRHTRPQHPEFWIVGRDAAKWAPPLKPAAQLRARGLPGRLAGFQCPDCGAILVRRVKDAEAPGGERLEPWGPADLARHTGKNHRCPACGAVLWTIDRTKPGHRRWPIARVLQRQLRKVFDYGIFDELHEFKNDSLQGQAMHWAVQACRRRLGLTGTLFSGYASDLYWLQWRLDPAAMRADGFTFGQLQAWIQRYGVLEDVTRVEDATGSSYRAVGGTRTITRERPGVSAAVFPRHLMGNTAWLEMTDLAASLPPYTEIAELVDMDPAQAADYHAVEQAFLLAAHRRYKGSFGVWGAFLTYANLRPDYPFSDAPLVVRHRERDPVSGAVRVQVETVATPAALPDHPLPKELRVIDVVRRECAEGRRVVLFGLHLDVLRRYGDVLTRAGVRAVWLRDDTVPRIEREQWFARQAAAGVDVVLTEPGLIPTGVDLLDFPTIGWIQPTWDVLQLRQASARAYRITQTHPCRVYYFGYRETVQAHALSLIGAKLEASLALEGRFSEEGLHALMSGESLTTELARLLLDKLTVDTPEAIWARLRAKAGWSLLRSEARPPVEALECLKEPAVVGGLSAADPLPGAALIARRKGRRAGHPLQLGFDF